MKQIVRIIYFLLLCSSCPLFVQGQETITATGGTITGSSGSATYTAGQLVFNVITGAGFSIIQGVQQPYEISVVTEIENTNKINLECIVYPNPTAGLLKLSIKSSDHENFSYLLYDLNGILLQDKKIESEAIEISLASFSSSIFFLKVINDKMEVKVFKIIKK